MQFLLITKIWMAISWKPKELAEIHLCQNDRSFYAICAKQARKLQDAQAEELTSLQANKLTSC